MALIPMRTLLDHAAENDYGVGAFNVNNMEQIQAIMMAATETNSPVIVQASRGARSYSQDNYLRHLMIAAVELHQNLPIGVLLQEGDQPREALGGTGLERGLVHVEEHVRVEADQQQVLLDPLHRGARDLGQLLFLVVHVGAHADTDETDPAAPLFDAVGVFQTVIEGNGDEADVYHPDPPDLGDGEWSGWDAYPIYERSCSFDKGLRLDEPWDGGIDPFIEGVLLAKKHK